ncbi:MAG TPA: EamA family transporter [Acidobacteriaceae bacterium]|nr:EamA family transporter [Acidobacteriaceae bacterium]
MILVMIIAGPFGNVLLGKGMKHLGRVTLWPVPALFHTGVEVFSTPMIWFGIACLIAFFISYMLALSWADYSFVQPTASLAYGVVALLSLFILGEHVSLLRWAGIAVICIGVFVVSHTAPNTTRGRVQEEN